MIDICLMVEGTYPYVAGGVSTWVHQLITAMHDLRFGVVYLAANADPTRTLKYTLPDNVIALHEIYLHDYRTEDLCKRQPTAHDFALLRQFYEQITIGNPTHFAELAKCCGGPTQCFDINTLFHAPLTWELLCDFAERFAPDSSFLDFFWTWRSTHLPLMQVLMCELPPARIYHAISTGYAGLLAAVAKVRTGAPTFLTEHGIYTYERFLEITQADWIYERTADVVRAERELSLFKRWWIALFHSLSRIAYTHVDHIFTLYGGNRTRQIADGAPPERIHIIPNGIDVKKSASITRVRRPTPHVGLVGRVVRIKDVKTFITAAERVLTDHPDVHFWIIGPADEEPDYATECERLVETLQLDDRVTFTGRAEISEYYAFLDLVVLTSISEAQPYVILEANAAHIPVVASDVGACRELIEGRDPEDALLGPSGIVTEVANPAATAAAIVRLLDDRALYESAANAGAARVALYYDERDLLSRYLNWYEQHL